MEPFEIMVSESQERMLCVVEPARVDEVLACARAGRSARRRSARSPTAGACACCDGDEVVGDMPVDGARRRLPALRPRARGAGARRIYPAPAANARRRGPERGAARAARLAEHRLAPAAVRAVRLDRAVAHRAPPGGGRRRRAPAARDGSALAVSIDGNGRRVAADPYRGDDRGGARVRREPRLRRRRAARDDELPELRQPREAAHRLAARPRRCAASATPAARSTCRSSAATSRSTTRRRGPDLPDAGRRHGRRAARRRPRAAVRLRRGGRRDRASPARSCPTARGSELAKLRGEPLPDGLPEVDAGGLRAPQRRRSARRCARARLTAPTTSPRAASPSRWPSAAWPAAAARGSTSATRPGRRASRAVPVRRGPGRLDPHRRGRGARGHVASGSR